MITLRAQKGLWKLSSPQQKKYLFLNIGVMTVFLLLELNLSLLHCKAGTCFDGECEGLHIAKEDRELQKTWPPPPSGAAQLIVAAGPERSGL